MRHCVRTTFYIDTGDDCVGALEDLEGNQTKCRFFGCFPFTGVSDKKDSPILSQIIA